MESLCLEQAAVGPPPAPPDSDALRRISEVVYRSTGIRIGPGKDYFVVGRLGGLYRELGCRQWAEFPERLAGAPHLMETLVQSVVTGETSFFRDGVPFRALREEIVPSLATGAGGGRALRVWSAGCSTGQEPYSVVMALWEEVERGLDLQVWATDICSRALARAREGIYRGDETCRGIDEHRFAAFFESVEGGRARIRAGVKARVRFERFNLVADRPPNQAFHVVFCRNVAIYFDAAARERLWEAVDRALIPGGHAFLGAAETLFPSLPAFETVYFERHLLFRKRTERINDRKASGRHDA